jgi:hypothetical protein
MTPDISTEEIVDALTETEGNQVMAAARLGCCRQFIWKRAKTEPAIRAAIRQGTKRRIRVAEDRLHELVEAGDFRAIRFFLITQGKDQGWVERQEVTGAGGTELVIRFVDAPTGDDAGD